MTLNGEPYGLKEPMAVSELLIQAGFDPARVAVLLNGQIVAREAFGTTETGGEDALEVLSFVGGG